MRTKMILSASALIVAVKVSPVPAKYAVHAPANSLPHVQAANLAPSAAQMPGTSFKVAGITTFSF